MKAAVVAPALRAGRRRPAGTLVTMSPSSTPATRCGGVMQYKHPQLPGRLPVPPRAEGIVNPIPPSARPSPSTTSSGTATRASLSVPVCGRPTPCHQGETLGNVAFGIDYLANSRPSSWATTSPSSVWATRHGLRPHCHSATRTPRHLLRPPRRKCISASEHEVQYAKLEGVGFRFCKAR